MVAKVLTAPRLIIRLGDGETVYPILRASIVLGRIDSADVVLNDPTVSRVHARLDQTQGGHHVADLGSRAGTLVNGKSVDEKGIVLHNGDEIRLGSVVLRYER